MNWVAIRGPIGPHRHDIYTSMIAMHAGKPYPQGSDVSIDDFAMPWAPPPPPDADE